MFPESNPKFVRSHIFFYKVLPIITNIEFYIYIANLSSVYLFVSIINELMAVSYVKI